MTEKEYRSHPAISRSELWRMNESPERFKWFREHPMQPTPALLFGQVVHKMLLEPETYDSEFVTAPAINRRTNEGKEAYERFMKENEGKAVVPIDMSVQALDMTGVALRNPIVQKLLEGEHEKPFFWTDPDTGIDCKCRVDILTELDGVPTIVDYKSTTCAATEVFNQEIFRFGYHFQAAMYSTGVMEAMGLSERPDFLFIAQEKKAPFSLNLIRVSPEVMLAGLDKYHELLGMYRECLDTDYWYDYLGPFGEPNETTLPGWMQLGVEEEDG